MSVVTRPGCTATHVKPCAAVTSDAQLRVTAGMDGHQQFPHQRSQFKLIPPSTAKACSFINVHSLSLHQVLLLMCVVRSKKCMPCSEEHSRPAVRFVHNDRGTAVHTRTHAHATHMHNFTHSAEAPASQCRLHKSRQRHGGV